jgi:hypothetical protein
MAQRSGQPGGVPVMSCRIHCIQSAKPPPWPALLCFQDNGPGDRYRHASRMVVRVLIFFAVNIISSYSTYPPLTLLVKIKPARPGLPVVYPRGRHGCGVAVPTPPPGHRGAITNPRTLSRINKIGSIYPPMSFTAFSTGGSQHIICIEQLVES